MLDGGWVASDSTKYSLNDQRPNWISLVSVAVAVSDVQSFDEKYFDIMDSFVAKHDMRLDQPIVKNIDINRWCSDHTRKQARREIVKELLQIEQIETIQITETSLNSEWVTIFTEQADKRQRIESEKFIENHLQPYYNLVSIWEYLRKAEKRPTTYNNVITDSFEGEVSPAWIQIGIMSDELKVIPKGDQVYPILSLSDLVIEYAKQEVDSWGAQSIYEEIKQITPSESAWVDVDSIDSEQEISMIAPHRRNNVNTQMLRPSPTVFIDSSGFGQKTVQSFDFYNHACRFAYECGGCVTFLDESNDQWYFGSDDYIITLKSDRSKFEHYMDFNNTNSPTVLDSDQAMELFRDELDSFSSD